MNRKDSVIHIIKLLSPYVEQFEQQGKYGQGNKKHFWAIMYVVADQFPDQGATVIFIALV